MRIFLQSTRTLKFLSNRKQKRGQSWTTELAGARAFGTPLDALYHCYRRGIANMQILGAFADARQNIIISVTGSRMI